MASMWRLFVLAEILLLLPQYAIAAEETERHALLVGVTEYDHLSDDYWLDGPENDAQLLCDLLIGRFSFSAENITLLTHSRGVGDSALQPTRGNIEREFSRLAGIARQNPQASFVIFLAGHGSQQSNTNDDAETDGYDEIFLPQDVVGWGGASDSPTIQNAITDDELADWLKEITDTGAFACVIIDACHSGTMTRSIERTRSVPWEALTHSSSWKDVPIAVADPPRPLSSRGAESPATLLDADADSPRLVAIYAAQSTEPTVERLMPYGRYDIPDRQVHGLLTFTISEVLQNANGSLSYRELMESVQACYDGWGRRGPTPAVEGPIDRIVFESTLVDRSQIRLRSRAEEPLSINQGGVHGITTGTILAVYPPAGRADTDDLLGHVVVVECRTLDADVEPLDVGESVPVARPAFEDGARCEITVLPYDEQLRTSIAVDALDSSGASVPRDVYDRLSTSVIELAKQPGAWIRHVTLQEDPEWVLRWDAGELHIVSADVADLASGDGSVGASAPAIAFGPHPDDDGADEWVASVLQRIVHVRNLRRIASLAGDHGLARVPFEFQVLTHPAENREAGDMTATRPRLGPGDILHIEMSNPNAYPIDVTLLYIDATYGVASLFPQRSENNRLQPGDRHTIAVRLTAEPVGVESFLAIAVPGEGQSVSFSMLTQPSIAEIEAIDSMRRDAERVFESPLGTLLRNATYQSARGEPVTPPVDAGYAIHLFTWEVLTTND